MSVVPCICTQCVFHGNKSNFNAGIYVIMTILNTNLGLSQISPQRIIRLCYIYDQFIQITFNSPTLAHFSVYSTYLSSIYFYLQNFYLLWFIFICFTLLNYLCLYILCLFSLHNLFSFTLIYLIYFTLFLFTLLISFIREFYCEPACSNYKIYWFLSDYSL